MTFLEKLACWLWGALIGTSLTAWIMSTPPRIQAQVKPSLDARIWSKACHRLGRDTYAWQSDGGKWKVICIRRNS